MTDGDLARLVSSVADSGHILEVDGETIAVFPARDGKILAIGRTAVATYTSLAALYAGEPDLTLPYPCRCPGLAGWLGRITRAARPVGPGGRPGEG